MIILCCGPWRNRYAVYEIAEDFESSYLNSNSILTPMWCRLCVAHAGVYIDYFTGNP